MSDADAFMAAEMEEEEGEHGMSAGKVGPHNPAVLYPAVTVPSRPVQHPCYGPAGMLYLSAEHSDSGHPLLLGHRAGRMCLRSVAMV